MPSQRVGEPVGEIVARVAHVVGADVLHPAFARGEDFDHSFIEPPKSPASTRVFTRAAPSSPAHAAIPVAFAALPTAVFIGTRANGSSMVNGRASFQRACADVAGKFCVGDEPSIADCCLIPQLVAARRFGVDIAKLDLLLGIEQRCLALPAFQNAAPDRQPDAIK